MVSRGTGLTGTAGDALATMTPVTSTLAAARRDPERESIPRTMATRRTLTNGSLREETTAFQLTHLGVTWQGPDAQVRLRTKAGWTPWRAISGCGAGPDRGGDPAGGSALLVVPATVGYDVRVSGTGTAQITELNTVDGPTVQATAAVETGMRLPDGTVVPVPYLSRAAWGADESLRFRNGVEYWPPEYYPTQTLTVHHTAGANNDPDPAATIRAIYYYQAIGQDWGDIGYHLLIDEAGRVYEGRWSGTDVYPVFDATLGADRRPRMSTGAHVYLFNTGNAGVCLLGDFTNQLPTTAAVDSLATVLAGLARINGLDPQGTTNYVNPVNPPGTTRTVRTISGHRDWAATQCPGNTFYPQLPALRDTVAARIPVSRLPTVRKAPPGPRQTVFVTKTPPAVS
jgi:hypothetical protein